jgi:hypothetical protein
MNMNELQSVSPRHSLMSVRFLLSAAILVLAAVVLQPGTKAIAEKYEKKPIAIRKHLGEFDATRLPSFRTGYKIRKIPAQVEDIETNEYIHMAVTRNDILHGAEHIEFLVTYYSNPRDKVPHTPDVCSRQAGATVRELTTITLDVPGLGAEQNKIKCKCVVLDWEKYSTVVIYVFFVEGKFRHTREQVRWDIGMPGHPHTYFSKIDVVASFPLKGDPTQALDTCKTFLSEALPILLSEYFPTDEQIKVR